jgi:hypothetical protein
MVELKIFKTLRDYTALRVRFDSPVRVLRAVCRLELSSEYSETISRNSSFVSTCHAFRRRNILKKTCRIADRFFLHF